MQRAIVGFRQDEHGEWAAELECGHGQHIRHKPPFQVRPWVLTEEGRAGRIGTELDCPHCNEAETPSPPG